MSAGEQTTGTGRFAPSTTGPAHAGTLLAALLCWLDARSRGDRVLLRLEDLDPQRCRPEWTEQLPRDLAWLGLDWDAVEHQSDARERHAQALDRLAAVGLLYPCACTRNVLRERAERLPDGSFRYPGTCRGRPLPAGGWRASREPLRVRLEPGSIELEDESGLAFPRDPARAFGDPLVRRRDGAVAYQLACIVDDAAAGVTRVVRGRDLASSTPVQVALQRCLGLEPPRYRHHFLLLEEHGGKLSKLHGAVHLEALRPRYSAEELCGWLAQAAGLQPELQPLRPEALVRAFSWSRVREADRLVRWDGDALELGP